MFESPGKWHKLYSDDFGHHLCFLDTLYQLLRFFSASVLKANCSHDLLKASLYTMSHGKTMWRSLHPQFSCGMVMGWLAEHSELSLTVVLIVATATNSSNNIEQFTSLFVFKMALH